MLRLFGDSCAPPESRQYPPVSSIGVGCLRVATSFRLNEPVAFETSTVNPRHFARECGFSFADSIAASRLRHAINGELSGICELTRKGVMKTLVILLIGFTAMAARPATAGEPSHAYRASQQAHALAAYLLNATTPYAPYNAAWNRAARRAMETNLTAEAVLAALAAGDFCAAHDAADRLKDLTDDLQDAVEDLGLFSGCHLCRDDIRQLECVADELDDLAGDLRRETKRLDQREYVLTPPIAPICPAPPAPCGIVPYSSSPWNGSADFGYGINDAPRRRPAIIAPPVPVTPSPYDLYGPSSVRSPVEVDGHFSGSRDQFNGFGQENIWPGTSSYGDFPPSLARSRRCRPGK